MVASDETKVKLAASKVKVSAIAVKAIVSASISELEIDVPSVDSIVTVSVAPPVVVIPVPAAIVIVSPALIVWLEPEVPARVRANVPPGPEVKQVEQEISPALEREIGDEALTATVPEAAGNVQVTSAPKLAEVMVPVKLEFVSVVWGLIAIVSLPEVVEENAALPVPFRMVLNPILVSEPVMVQLGLLLAAELAKVK